MKVLEIDKNDVISNLEAIKSRCPGVEIYGVLKNDAYGLGMLNIAHCMRDAGVSRFAVCEPDEAVTLRRGGFTDEEILMLRSCNDPNEIEALLDTNVVASVGSQESAMVLSGIAERRSTVAEAHLKIDTGFGRYGFLYSEPDKIVNIYQYMQGIAFSGIYTHLDSKGSQKHAELQIKRFEEVLRYLREKGIETGTVHAQGSSALFKFKGLPLFNAVRAGAAVSGRLPGKNGLKKIGLIRTEVSEVRWLPSKSHVSGGKLRHPAKVGILPVGYADGYGIERPSRAPLIGYMHTRPAGMVRLEGGDRLNVLGRPGQNHIMVDLSSGNAGVGTKAFVEVDPLFAGRMKKVLK